MLAAQPTFRQKALAWSVHAITATGALWGMLAILAIFEERWLATFLWMVAAMLADGIDGTLARRFHTQVYAAALDGALLDNIVDYLTYVVVPALFLYRANLFPPALALVGIAVIVLTSAYQFSQVNAKTDDHYFTGFPSYWNVIVFFLFFLQQSPLFNFLIVALCGILVFVPIKYIYPSRAMRWQRPTMGLSLLWGLVNVLILVQYARYSAPQPWLVWASVAYVFYYVGLSLYATWQGRSARSDKPQGQAG